MIYVNGRFLTQTLTGSQRFAYEMLKSLVRHFGDGVNVLVPPADIKQSYNIIGFPVKIIGSNKSAIWEQLDLPFFLNRNGKPLLINLVNTAPIFYKNQIISIMDMTTFINPSWFSKAFSLYYQILIPKIVKKSKVILTISECSKKDIIKYTGVDPFKIEILYCSVSDSFKNLDVELLEDQSVLSKFNLNKHGYLLAVSSLDPRKNFAQLVKEFSEIKSNIPLVIVGTQGKVFANEELKELLTNARNVILTGYLTDTEVKDLYSSALCFIYPSLYEGFGIPPLEAMACNCPTIVSNVSSLPEVCGNASVYINPYEKSSITNAIDQIINDKDLRICLIDLGKIQWKKFSWSESGLKLKSIIEKIKQ